jgi:hypothetical protein
MEGKTRVEVKADTPQNRSVRYVKCLNNAGDNLSLTPGQFYQVLPDEAEEHGLLRIVDNTGEDYLFDAELFEEVQDLSSFFTELTIGLSVPIKATIYQLANQQGKSMSALLREWIDERLDLPIGAD